ncbi:MAG: hypothetical protein LIP03_04810 [Bacteroidales bacterium]|nr:hypothetical protein [Bacteroidales bacterium]
MAEIKIGGIMRAGAYSPNHIGNDSAIFNMVADQLRKRGMQVNIYSEEQLLAGRVTENVIIDMCREPRSLEVLQQMEDDGALVINSGYGIENCTRERMTRILLGNSIPYPESIIVNTDEMVQKRLNDMGISRCWIKRGDFHAKHKEDVTSVRHPEEAQEVVQEYFLRGIKRAVINRHLEGDLVKFYGVLGTPFFYWFYPYDKHVGTEDEMVNGVPRQYKFDQQALHDTCTRAAEALGVVIYGGDAIVAPDGSFSLIDFNDWPSFAPCRVQAAPIIARRIMSLIKQHNSKQSTVKQPRQ